MAATGSVGRIFAQRRGRLVRAQLACNAARDEFHELFVDPDQGALAGANDPGATLEMQPQHLRGTVGHHRPQPSGVAARDGGGAGVVGVGLVSRA
jgi:hypothetical protein